MNITGNGLPRPSASLAAAAATLPETWLGNLGRALWDGLEACIARRALRSAAGRLQTLDDRILKDIGLQRGEIEGFLRDLQRQRKRDTRSPK